MVVIIDYGAGNSGSIVNMLKRIGKQAIVTSDQKIIDQAERLILPGVGAFDFGMQNLEERNLIEILKKKAFIDKVPFLGICLGMQLMTKGSEEGIKSGLSWFDAQTIKFTKHDIPLPLKIPHMGWAEVKVKHQNELVDYHLTGQRFYFVHSYFVRANNQSDVILTANYGNEFACGLAKDNLFAVQFHPEKSHKFGQELLKQFTSL